VQNRSRENLSIYLGSRSIYMVYFDFGMDVVDRVVKEFNKAEKYIRIAIFQLHNQKVFEVLYQKLKSGVEVEIITLPYDSINEDIQERVIDQFESLQAMGARLHFCKWNIGDPERTSTAVGRWYSFHGKFIVTDKSAVSLSANFIDQSELDAVLIFENDIEKISEYNSKFDELLEMFVLPAANSNGTIRKNISDTNIPNVQALFKLPRIIETDTHKDHWITDYPSILCPDNLVLNDQLLFCPFDVKARNLFIDLIEEADKYVYISTESFTDLEIADYLEKKHLGILKSGF
jgi:phosphatidylserine/phosphatidylglycerophosphate/cardiolipin synthase-like enzyme